MGTKYSQARALQSDNEVLAVLRRHADGATTGTIAKELKISRSSVWPRLQRLLASKRIADTGEAIREGERGCMGELYRAVDFTSNLDPEEFDDELRYLRERNYKAAEALKRPAFRHPQDIMLFGEPRRAA